MPIPAVVVRSARQLWHCQWLQLMRGLGPADRQGHYRRPQPAVAEPPPAPAVASAGDTVLIVGRSCPWAHRAWLAWTLRGLAPAIELLVVEPDPQAGRWRFSTPFEGCDTLAQLYRLGGCDPRARATVPLLWSRCARQVLVSESARLIELLNLWPAPAPGSDPASAPASEAGPITTSLTAAGQPVAAPGTVPPGALCPPPHHEAIQAWRQRLQHTLNDGVYRCGLARSQTAYDLAEAELFATVSALEEALGRQRLAGSPWLCGGAGPSLADVCLFPTLIRWEMVYAPLFGCSRQPLWQFPELWRWRARFYQLPGVAATCLPEAWRRDYFGALFPLHPSGIIPAGPDLATLVLSSPPLGADDQQQL
ncbi:MAG: glutathione S-transferase C-terminal domain-containing protein [Synechococcaceae cyanobacterium]|jgi:putative glutathione S-transferase